MQNVVLNVLLKLCLATFLSNVALGTEALRSAELSNDGNVANNLAFPNHLIAENPADGLHEQGVDETHPGETANDRDPAFQEQCSYHSDLQVTQESSYLPNGLPLFSVTFTNTCLDCAFSDIIIGCGHFASSKWVDPAIFRRFGDRSCLLNNGNPIAPQNTVAFEYISTFSYPMTVVRAQSSCA